MRHALTLAVLLLLAACGDDLGLDELRFACDDDHPCAAGWSCTNGSCVEDGTDAPPDTDVSFCDPAAATCSTCWEFLSCLTACETSTACAGTCVNGTSPDTYEDEYAPMLECWREECGENAACAAAVSLDGACESEWDKCLQDGVVTDFCRELAPGACLDCAGVLTCTGACGTDVECQRGCLAQASRRTQIRALNASICGQLACPQGAEGCTADTIRTLCPDIFDECAGD